MGRYIRLVTNQLVDIFSQDKLLGRYIQSGQINGSIYSVGQVKGTTNGAYNVTCGTIILWHLPDIRLVAGTHGLPIVAMRINVLQNIGINTLHKRSTVTINGDQRVKQSIKANPFEENFRFLQ